MALNTIRFREATLAEDRPGGLVTVWDSSVEPAQRSGPVYLWNGYAEAESVQSILRYVEANADRLRGKYLAWTHDLGESRISGRRLVDRLVLPNGLSYWWMTPFVEQSPWKLPAVVDAIKLFALDEILQGKLPQRLRFVSADRELSQSIQELCQRLGIAFELQAVSRVTANRTWLRRVYRALPLGAQAWVELFLYLYARWPLRRLEPKEWRGAENSLFVCSYLFHLNAREAANGCFYSHYWEGLPSLIQRRGLSINWLELYYPHEAIPNTKVALEWLRRFNSRRTSEGFHAFLDAYLCLGTVRSVLQGWYRLARASRGMRDVRPAFRPGGSNVSLWPIMRRFWLRTLHGPDAISNLLSIDLFDRAMRHLPVQLVGLYLCENQAWERALIYAWRKHGHGKLIAVAHSTVRYWDLRYFNDLRTIQSKAPYPMPQADVIALNGKAAVDAYLQADYPVDRIAECEALRFQHLNNAPIRRLPARMPCGKTRVLILGDFIPSSTNRMLELLAAAAPNFKFAADYTIKPHPNCPVRASDHPSLNLSTSTYPLDEILSEFDMAYASNMTSAAVDAYLYGLPVIVMLDDQALNFSPLRGSPTVSFVSTSMEMAIAFDRASTGVIEAPDREGFFFLDSQMPRWTALLNEYHHSNGISRYGK
jgi:surface carbohydrate biosynthesis protein (TIGR04326 family)